MKLFKHFSNYFSFVRIGKLDSARLEFEFELKFILQPFDWVRTKHWQLSRYSKNGKLQDIIEQQRHNWEFITRKSTQRNFNQKSKLQNTKHIGKAIEVSWRGWMGYGGDMGKWQRGCQSWQRVACCAAASRFIRAARSDSRERKGRTGRGGGVRGGRVGRTKRTRKDVPIGNCNCKSISFPRVLT